ncbi:MULTISPECIES: hypothetical protein [unclassified Clostridium]|uniref:hypothetical protein n=1 Tax=unclassified Clostridium TaxID=2614128 RepID=UPI0020799AA5|nr:MULTISPECIES: hypothetical protein [unclassified Clostridium]
MIAIKDNDNNIRRGYINATDIQLLDVGDKFEHKNLEDAMQELGSGTEQNMIKIEDKVFKLEEDKTNILKTIGQVNVETDGDIASQLSDLTNNGDITGGKLFRRYNNISNGTILETINNLISKGNLHGTFYVVVENITDQPIKRWGSVTYSNYGDGTKVEFKADNLNYIYIRNIYKSKWLEEWRQLATTERPQEFNITPLGGFNIVGGSKATYFKTQEGIVNVNAYLNSNNSITKDDLLVLNLPVGYRPIDAAIRTVGITNFGIPNGSVVTEVIVFPNGDIKFNAVNAFSISFNLSFIGR